jgi:hypothetical protein
MTSKIIAIGVTPGLKVKANNKADGSKEVEEPVLGLAYDEHGVVHPILRDQSDPGRGRVYGDPKCQWNVQKFIIPDEASK